MYTLIKSASLSRLAVEAPSLAVSVLTAEQFYKFGSFSLELAACFATWYCLSRATGFVLSRTAMTPFKNQVKND